MDVVDLPAIPALELSSVEATNKAAIMAAHAAYGLINPSPGQAAYAIGQINNLGDPLPAAMTAATLAVVPSGGAG